MLLHIIKTYLMLKKNVFSNSLKLKTGVVSGSIFKRLTTPLLFSVVNNKNKYTQTVNLSLLNLFLFGNSILFKKVYYFFIKYNSFSKQKKFIFSIFGSLKMHFSYFKKKEKEFSFIFSFKGKLGVKGSSKKKKLKYCRGSFFSKNKKFFIDYKPSSSSQGCVNSKLVFKIN